MKLSIEGIRDTASYEAAGVALPTFDVAQMQEAGKANPRWVHIGPGNIFRIFTARVAHDLLAAGHHWPIAGVIPLDPAELDTQLAPFDLMTLGVTLNPDGKREMKVIAGMSEVVATRREADYARYLELMRAQSVTLLSFTITEKGYVIEDSSGALQESVVAAFTKDPLTYHPNTMVLVAAGLYARFTAGAAPITLLSTDNFSHNGDKLRKSVLTIVDGWVASGMASAEFREYVADESRVAFPISVIDKITPRPNPSIAAELAELGFTDLEVQTVGRAAFAGFVNAEPTEYLIIEDKFAAERPPFEEFGVHIVERQVCDDFENMKVTTCLNPLHTALAISGMLLGFPTIDAEMRDAALAKMVNRLGSEEGLPVVVDPKIVTPQDFLREVLEVRFPNEYLPDSPARIAMDTSQKLPIRFGETIKKYQSRGMDLAQLQVIPLVYALWARYLLGVDDQGATLELASDPLLDELTAQMSAIKLGESDQQLIHTTLAPIFSNPQIFGVNLYDTPLAAKAEALFTEMITGAGAVRSTIDKEMN
ncbi:mannitol dehydrogenase family protein [Arcanobacterium hippocoleae]|uniref:Fructuronate reductase n=1 Tax=Arcanobacterium hippocoleae TaxID=149017 RepID=A0ABU1T3G6_9ACTO|nr:mannitol dehydrogenase family protein [Arcanobacterium hippocoleae]MDR6939912.1 fructuronate reductase [Arcanobacterium hippocoleae]